MLAKEKALELVSDIYSIQSEKYDYGIDWEMSKKCALICIDEIIKEIENNFLQRYNAVDRYHYWKEVKEEMEKL